MPKTQKIFENLNKIVKFILNTSTAAYEENQLKIFVELLDNLISSSDKNSLNLILNRIRFPNIGEYENTTLLMICTLRNHKLYINELLKRGADPKQLTRSEQYWGTPIHQAVETDKVDVLKLLLEKVDTVVGVPLCDVKKLQLQKVSPLVIVFSSKILKPINITILKLLAEKGANCLEEFYFKERLYTIIQLILLHHSRFTNEIIDIFSQGSYEQRILISYNFARIVLTLPENFSSISDPENFIKNLIDKMLPTNEKEQREFENNSEIIMEFFLGTTNLVAEKMVSIDQRLNLKNLLRKADNMVPNLINQQLNQTFPITLEENQQFLINKKNQTKIFSLDKIQKFLNFLFENKKFDPNQLLLFLSPKQSNLNGDLEAKKYWVTPIMLIVKNHNFSLFSGLIKIRGKEIDLFKKALFGNEDYSILEHICCNLPEGFSLENMKNFLRIFLPYFYNQLKHPQDFDCFFYHLQFTLTIVCKYYDDPELVKIFLENGAFVNVNYSKKISLTEMQRLYSGIAFKEVNSFLLLGHNFLNPFLTAVVAGKKRIAEYLMDEQAVKTREGLKTHKIILRTQLDDSHSVLTMIFKRLYLEISAWGRLPANVSEILEKIFSSEQNLEDGLLKNEKGECPYLMVNFLINFPQFTNRLVKFFLQKFDFNSRANFLMAAYQLKALAVLDILFSEFKNQDLISDFYKPHRATSDINFAKEENSLLFIFELNENLLIEELITHANKEVISLLLQHNLYDSQKKVSIPNLGQKPLILLAIQNSKIDIVNLLLPFHEIEYCPTEIDSDKNVLFSEIIINFPPQRWRLIKAFEKFSSPIKELLSLVIESKLTLIELGCTLDQPAIVKAAVASLIREETELDSAIIYKTINLPEPILHNLETFFERKIKLAEENLLTLALQTIHLRNLNLMQPLMEKASAEAGNMFNKKIVSGVFKGKTYKEAFLEVNPNQLMAAANIEEQHINLKNSELECTETFIIPELLHLQSELCYILNKENYMFMLKFPPSKEQKFLRQLHYYILRILVIIEKLWLQKEDPVTSSRISNNDDDLTSKTVGALKKVRNAVVHWYHELELKHFKEIAKLLSQNYLLDPKSRQKMAKIFFEDEKFFINLKSIFVSSKTFNDEEKQKIALDGLENEISFLKEFLFKNSLSLSSKKLTLQEKIWEKNDNLKFTIAMTLIRIGENWHKLDALKAKDSYLTRISLTLSPQEKAQHRRFLERCYNLRNIFAHNALTINTYFGSMRHFVEQIINLVDLFMKIYSFDAFSSPKDTKVMSSGANNNITSEQLLATIGLFASANDDSPFTGNDVKEVPSPLI